MLTSVISLFLAQAAPTIAPAQSRIARPVEAAVPIQAENFVVRVSGQGALLWQGRVRVTRNQGTNYNQSLSQASGALCPPDYHYDRSQSQNVTFSMNVQDNQVRGRSYRVSATWQRPMPDLNCGESESRSVSVNSTVILDANGKAVIEGDAGLRIEIDRE